MLPAPDHIITILDRDGQAAPFDADALQRAVAAAFAAAGDPDGYLAEDVTLAVESSLLSSAAEGRSFTRSEVDSLVIRILEWAGCAEAARVFGRSGSRLEIAVDPAAESVRPILERHLGVGGSVAEELTLAAIRAVKQLGFETAAPALYLELAREYEHRLAPPELPPAVAAAPEEGKKPGRWLVAPGAAEAHLEGEAKELFEQGILKFAGVARLYPNFRLSLDLARLAARAELEPPVTELALAPALARAGEAARAALTAARKLLPEGAEFPVYLKLPELEHFVRTWMEADYPAGKRDALEMLGAFRMALGVPLRRVTARE